MITDELVEKAIRQENAKARLLIAVAEAVVELMSDKGDEWDSEPYRKANHITDLLRGLMESSK